MTKQEEALRPEQVTPAVVDLLHRIGASRGSPSLKDCAMASILAFAMERRQPTPQHR